MNDTVRRRFWNGSPVALETLWTMRKGSRVASCVLYTHDLGWELKVESGDLLLTQVCRTDQEIESVSAGWSRDV